MWGLPRKPRVGPTTGELVGRYAAAFESWGAADVGVRSPLGVWLLLSLLAPASQADARRELESLLGTTAEDAFRRALDLLQHEHPDVGVALGLWGQRALCTDSFFEWVNGVGNGASTGAVPEQSALDAWASEATRGLISKFPLQRDPSTAIILANALATNIAWSHPFELATGEALGGPFGHQVRHALRSVNAHEQSIHDTRSAGRVAVHQVDSGRALVVASVIAEPHHRPGEVLKAAYEALGMLGRESAAQAQHVDLFNLPLGDGHAWTLTEVQSPSAFGDRRVSEFHSTMPSWRADCVFGLEDAPGVSAAFAAMRQFVRPEAPRPIVFEARQTATAQFGRFGFRAGAVSAFQALLGSAAPKRRPGTLTTRIAEIRFNRPYAVVAFAQPVTFEEEDMGWIRVPVFSAWVQRPDEVSEADLAGPPNAD